MTVHTLYLSSGKHVIKNPFLFPNRPNPLTVPKKNPLSPLYARPCFLRLFFTKSWICAGSLYMPWTAGKAASRARLFGKVDSGFPQGQCATRRIPGRVHRRLRRQLHSAFSSQGASLLQSPLHGFFPI